MNRLLAILFCLVALTTSGQHIALTGGIFNADSMRITVYHGGKVVSTQHVVGRVYSIFLGDNNFYEIWYESNDRIKILHFFCYNIKDPVSIEQNVHFANQVNCIMWYWRSDPNSSKLKIERTYWGPHASWKDEF